MSRRKSSWPDRFGERVAQLSGALANARAVLGRGEPVSYQAPHDVALSEGFLRLRRYEPQAAPRERVTGEPLVLVPPLMITAEVYDISPDLSAVGWLTARGVDVWVTDFGVPEREEGGLDRTLEQHILAVDRAVSFVCETTGKPVHLAGYSQGGMFAYLTAAYRENRGLRSVITFGSPVDMRKNFPAAADDEVAARLLAAAGDALRGAISDLDGLSGALSSTGFKLVSPAQELKYLFKMIGLLGDREQLERVLPQRRFLSGEGFTAFPGPALRAFLKELIARNRLITGGLVIAGRTVGLSVITVPVLYVVGSRDTFARPDSVRAIRQVVASEQCSEVLVDAGHFGLVVGSRAMSVTWPTVAQWIRWLAGGGPRPEQLDAPSTPPTAPAAIAPDRDRPAARGAQRSPGRQLLQRATRELGRVWSVVGALDRELTERIGVLRWQVPRLARLAALNDASHVSPSRMLARQAKTIPERPFFIWRGRAFSFRDADRRVNQVADVLQRRGIRTGRRVGIYMDNRPDYLTSVCAINRLGAVAVLLPPAARGSSLAHAIEVGRLDLLICDGDHLERACAAMAADKLLVLALFGAGRKPLPAGAEDLEAAIDPARSEPPPGVPASGGKAGDLAMLMFTSGTTGMPKAARITNRRWAMAALASAAGCRLTRRDTVYCCLPLHHATGLLVAVGGAMLGGARLVLAERFSVSTFLSDVRRTGTTVVFYVGELCRYLVSSGVQPDDRHHAIRLFAGNGMDAGVWRRLLDKFGSVRVLEFYGSTEGNAFLVNLTGDKIGSVGRPPFDGQQLALARYDVARGAFVRDPDGFCIECGLDEPGVLLGRVKDDHPAARFDGYTDAQHTRERLLRDVFEPGDRWFHTGDLLRRDADGDYWFVDRLGDTFRWKGENVSTAEVETVLARADPAALVVVYGVQLPGREGRVGAAAIELADRSDFDGQRLGELVSAHLASHARPRFIRLVDTIELTPSLKPKKHLLQEQGVDPARVAGAVYAYDEAQRSYRRLEPGAYDSYVASL